MIRISSYNIYLDLKNEKNEYLLVHGYTGAVDVVSEDIYRILERAQEDSSELQKLKKEDIEVLEKRGYITEKNQEEEKMTMKKIAGAIQSIHSKYVSVTLIPTYNCNFRCVYCYEQQLLRNGINWLNKTMDCSTVDATMKYIDKLRESGKIVEDLWLFGGEPLIKENYEIVKYIVEKAKEKNVKIRCVTNGYDLENFEDLIGTGKIETLQITIDGVEKTHDNRRFRVGKQPSFKKIMSNIDLCLKKELGCNIVIRSNMDKKNINEIAEIVDLFKSKGWYDNKYFSSYFKATHACYIKNDDNPLNDIQVMREIQKKVPSTARLGFESMYSAIAYKFKYLFENKGYSPLKAGFCGAVNGGLAIDPFNKVYPCWDVLGKERERIGEINSEGELTLNERADYWKNRLSCEIEECSNCPYVLFCGGGCPAHAQIVNKDAYTHYCNYFKEIFNEVVPVVYKKTL